MLILLIVLAVISCIAAVYFDNEPNPLPFWIAVILMVSFIYGFFSLY